MANNNKKRSKKSRSESKSLKRPRARRGSRDSIELFVNDGIFIDDRTIHLFEDIDADSVSRVIKGIQILMLKNKEPINILINSYGGECYSGFALYDFIRSQKDVVIRTYNVGCCMSMATVIFLAGDERLSYPNARFMFHTVSGGTDGKLFEIDTDNKETKAIFKRICEIYAEKSTWSLKEWERKLRYEDYYLDANKAKDLKIVDKIVESE